MTVTRACPTCGYTSTYRTVGLADYHHGRHSCAKHQPREHDRRRRPGDRPTRDCHHPYARHRHGTRAAYVRDRCRCEVCTAANTAASNHRHRERAYGRWAPYVDATPARAHIARLRAAGIGTNQIATLAGLSPSHIRGLIYPRRGGSPPHQRIRPDTEQRILAVPVDESSLAHHSQVPAVGTRRRLQALVAIGWPPTWLAHELHRTLSNLHHTMTSRTVTARTARQIRELYDRLWDTPPPRRTTTQRRATAACRDLARRNQWAPPMAWDDIDNDLEPAVRPGRERSNGERDIDEIAILRALDGDTTVHLTPNERSEAVRRLTDRGHSIRTIAARLATSTRTISRHRRTRHAA